MASPASPSSNAPNPFYRRHHQVLEPEISTAAFQPAFRVRSRVDRLFFVDKLISVREFQAAIAYRNAYALPHSDVFNSTLAAVGAGRRPKRSGRAPRPEYHEAQLDAVRRLHDIDEVLGPNTVQLLRCCLLADLPWRQLAERFGISAKTAKKWTVTTIRMLGAIW
jgi:hypothetical protein